MRTPRYSQYLYKRSKRQLDSFEFMGAEVKDVRSLRSPPPETERSVSIQSLEWTFPPPSWAVIKGDSQQYDLHHHHDQRLNQQGSIIPGARPVEYLEDGGCKHDKRDVEGEASGGAGTVDGEDLVGIGYHRRKDETVEKNIVSIVAK